MNDGHSIFEMPGMSEARNSIFTSKRESKTKIHEKFVKKKLVPLGDSPYKASKKDFGGKDKYVDGAQLQAKSPPRYRTR